MTAPAAELKVARRILGWDALKMAHALRLIGAPVKMAVRVHYMEAGKRDISGPVHVTLGLFLSGWCPSGWIEPSSRCSMR